MPRVRLSDRDTSRHPEFVQLKGKSQGKLLALGAQPVATPLDVLLSLETSALIQQRLGMQFPRQQELIRSRFGLKGETVALEVSPLMERMRGSDRKHFSQDDVTRVMGNAPGDLIHAVGAPKLLQLDTRLENIIFLTNKARPFVHALMERDVNTVREFRAGYHHRFRKGYTLEGMDRDITEILRGQFYSTGNGKPTSTPTKYFSHTFRMACEFAQIRPENALSRYRSRQPFSFRPS